MRSLALAFALVAGIGMVATGPRGGAGTGCQAVAWTTATTAPGASVTSSPLALAHGAALTPLPVLWARAYATTPGATRLAGLGVLALMCGAAALLRRRQGNFLRPQLERAA